MEVFNQVGAARVAEMEAHLAETQAELDEARATLQAIYQGEVDAVLVGGPEGDQVFTLQGAETPYRFLVEAMNEGALLLGLDGTVLFANARFASLASVPLEQVAGSPWHRFFAEAEQARLRSLLERARHSGTREESLLCTKDGRVCPVQLSLSPMTREGLEGVAVIVSDLAERKAAEEALARANARLRETVRELEHFSYTITHDMRAPLRALHGFAALLEDDGPERVASQGSYLRRIRVAAERMDLLIRDALSYAKVIQQELPLEPVSLGGLLRDLVETYPNLHPDQVEVELCGELPLVMGNRAALTQCFAKLLNNAAKFVAPGLKPQVRVWAQPLRNQGEMRIADCGLRNEEGEVGAAGSGVGHSAFRNPHSALIRVWVEDNGIGIAKNLHGRIFNMFERGTSEYEGTGIGLAIVRKVVQQMHGRVGVESEPGQGSRFWVELQATPRPQAGASPR